MYFSFHVSSGEGILVDHDLDDEVSTDLAFEDYFVNTTDITLSLYPTKAFYNDHQTQHTRAALFDSLVIIFMISLSFLTYDSCVRKVFTAKQDLLEAKRRFMRFVSHEVRTPLNAVCMGLDVLHHDMTGRTCQPRSVGHLAEGYEATRGDLELLEDVQSNAQTAVDVLNDMLNYDKVEHREMRLERSVIPLWHFIDNSFNEFRLPATKKSIDLTRFCSSENFDTAGSESMDCDLEQGLSSSSSCLPCSARLTCLIGDAFRLRQVFRNLLSNAIKFTAENGVIHVHVSAIKSDASAEEYEAVQLVDNQEVHVRKCGFVRISVKDNGVGLTSDQLGRLFGEGVQFNANRLQNGQGSGLGLFITKDIVERHEGSLQATSEGIGRGATFVLELPLYHVHDSEFTTQLESFSSVLPDNSKPFSIHIARLHILIVEDVVSNRKLLRRILERQGHICEEAENGQVALDKVRHSDRPYDTILMDFEMPVMDGPTATQQIRELDSDVFIVGVTGNTLSEDVEYFKSCGADAVVAKPVQLYELESLWHKIAAS